MGGDFTISKTQLTAIFYFFRSGIFAKGEFDTSVFTKIVELKNKCIYDVHDTRTNQLFKAFIYYGGNQRVIDKELKTKPDELSDTIYFKQADDIEITLIAKLLYSYTTKKFRPFLDWQVDVILENNKINIRHEYIKYLISLDWSEEGAIREAQTIKFE